MQHNSAWLEKEKARSTEGQKTEKKRSKKKVVEHIQKNALDAIKNTKLGEKINLMTLKNLLGSCP